MKFILFGIFIMLFGQALELEPTNSRVVIVIIAAIYATYGLNKKERNEQ